jgi:hypothetical protein
MVNALRKRLNTNNLSNYEKNVLNQHYKEFKKLTDKLDSFK